MRKPDRLNDYITRREAHALIVHVLTEMFAEPAPAATTRLLTPLEDQSAPPADELTSCGHYRGYACEHCIPLGGYEAKVVES